MTTGKTLTQIAPVFGEHLTVAKAIREGWSEFTFGSVHTPGAVASEQVLRVHQELGTLMFSEMAGDSDHTLTTRFFGQKQLSENSSSHVNSPQSLEFQA